MQQSSNLPEAAAPRAPRRRFSLKWQDVLALAIIAIVAYKMLVAPRIFSDRPYPAPALAMTALDGQTFSLGAQHGHVVFLDFWATWCEPCKISLPLVESYARAHPGSRVYAVDVGESRAVVAAFAHDHALTHVLLDPDQSIAGAFAVSGFPTMVVIDPNGMVRGKWVGLNPAIGAAMANADAKLK